MTANRCPNCDAQVLPGDVQCRRCKYDFILGKQLSSDPEADERRRIMLLRGGVLGGLLLAAVGVLLLTMIADREEEPITDDHPCLAALQRVQPVIAAAHSRGNPVPDCHATPPGPVACWDPVDVTSIHMPTIPSMSLLLSRTRSGFELQCRADLDGDGAHALYEANLQIDGVRISPQGVR